MQQGRTALHSVNKNVTVCCRIKSQQKSCIEYLNNLSASSKMPGAQNSSHSAVHRHSCLDVFHTKHSATLFVSEAWKHIDKFKICQLMGGGGPASPHWAGNILSKIFLQNNLQGNFFHKPSTGDDLENQGRSLWETKEVWSIYWFLLRSHKVRVLGIMFSD